MTLRPPTGPAAPGRCTGRWPGRWWRPRRCRWPDWYTALAPGSRAGDPDILAGSAAAAGFTRVQVRTVAVPTELARPAGLVSWRLGMAHYAPFLRSLDPAGRAAARRAAEQAVAASAPDGPLVVSITVLTAS